MTSRGALGLQRGVWVVVPYDPRWPEISRETAATLRDAPGSSILAIHDVVSTAVPGLCAKPILDVLVSIDDFDRTLGLVTQIEKQGYEFRPEEDIRDRHHFRRPAGGHGEGIA